MNRVQCHAWELNGVIMIVYSYERMYVYTCNLTVSLVFLHCIVSYILFLVIMIITVCVNDCTI